MMRNYLKPFWNYLKKDTWDSWIVSLILIIIFIKLIFFPLLSLVTGTPLPLVVVESCSMFHSSSFDTWWDQNSAYYESIEIDKSIFSEFPMKSGLNKGDIIFIWGHSPPKLGDIIVFEADTKHPVIHRVINLSPLSTKGDNNAGQLEVERGISQNKIMGKSAVKIPLLGWIKLIFFEPFKPQNQRGLCS